MTLYTSESFTGLCYISTLVKNIHYCHLWRLFDFIMKHSELLIMLLVIKGNYSYLQQIWMDGWRFKHVLLGRFYFSYIKLHILIDLFTLFVGSRGGNPVLPSHNTQTEINKLAFFSFAEAACYLISLRESIGREEKAVEMSVSSAAFNWRGTKKKTEMLL